MKRSLSLAVATLLLLAGCASTDSTGADQTSSTSEPEGGAETTTTTITTSDSSAATSEDITIAPAPSDSSEPTPLVNLDVRSQTPDTPSGYNVAYYGDSLAASAQEWVGTFLELGGRLNYFPGTFPGSAICDWYPRFDEDIASIDLWAVVLFFTNNTFSPCMKNADGSDLSDQEVLDKFRSDLGETIDRFTDAGATVYLPTIPTSRGELVLGINSSEELNGLFADLADGRDDVVLVEAGRAVLDADGNYAETLPCLPTEPCTGGVDENGIGVNLVREPDGVHFCSGGYGPDVPIETNTCPTWSSGAFRYAGALTAPIISAAQAQWSTDNPPSATPVQVTAAEE